MQRILVVDDEHLVADTLSLILRKCGFEARPAYSTDEALRCAPEFQPHLLICDITMPDRDGIELMDEMGRLLPECRVLVLTGYYDNLERVIEESRRMLYPAGLLTKPCQPAELVREAGLMLAHA